MRTYTGSQDVAPGLYFNVKKLSVKSIGSHEPLPGTTDDKYNRVPLPATLAISLLLGLAYVIFLPFIGLAMVAWLLGTKAVQLAATAAIQVVRVLRPGWVPSLAFLSRSKPAGRNRSVDEQRDAWTEEVEKKLNETNRHGQ
jgi:hypothetical protein